MRYLSKSFTLPTSSGVSQAEWDRIWAEPKPLLSDKYSPGQSCIHDPFGLIYNKTCCKSRAEGRNRRKAYRLSDINRTVEKRTGKSPALCSDAR